MEKIRVLNVEENKDGTTGGSHTCLANLVLSIEKDKYEPIVVFYEQNRFAVKFLQSGIKVNIYNKPRPKIFLLKSKYKRKIPERVFYNILLCIQKIYNFFRVEFFPFFYSVIYILKNKIDIVHLNNSLNSGLQWTLAAKILGKKSVIHHRVHHEVKTFQSKMHKLIGAYVFCVSECIKKTLIEAGFPEKNLFVLYDTIEQDIKNGKEENGEKIRQEFKVPFEKTLIVMVGNLQRWKGQLVLIEALHLLKNRYRNFHCLLVGDSSPKQKDAIKYLKEIKTLIHILELKEDITLTGHRQDVPEILNACDIFVHASTFPEPYGLVVLEAMRAGKPIIATNQGGPTEMIIDEKTGFLIEPNIPNLLSEKLDILCRNKQLRNSFGIKAKERFVKKFSSFDIKAVQNIYEKIAKKI